MRRREDESLPQRPASTHEMSEMHVDVVEIRHVQEMIASAREVMSVQITMTDRRLAQQIEDVDKRLSQAIAAEKLRVDQKIAEREKAHTADRVAGERAVEAALSTAKEAVGKSEISTDKRFESVNEFRAQLTDQATRFMPREVVDATNARFVAEIDTLKNQVTRIQAQAQALKGQRDENRDESSLKTAIIAAALAGVGLIITIIIIIVNHLGTSHP